MSGPEIAFMFSRAPDGTVVISWNPGAMQMDDLLQLLWSAAGVFPNRSIAVAVLKPEEPST